MYIIVLNNPLIFTKNSILGQFGNKNIFYIKQTLYQPVYLPKGISI